MNGNNLFLACRFCPTAADALLLAHRGSDSQYVCSAGSSKTDKWFAKHQKCGDGPDKFTVAFERPANWDVSPPADPIAASVRTEIALAQLNGSETEH